MAKSVTSTAGKLARNRTELEKMTNEEIVANLHKMVDQFAGHLANPVMQGCMPLIRITFKSDEDGDRLRLTVGADFVEDDE